ncbi:MAG: hypothetical protein RI841_02095, partial [Halomonas sp.]|nr:hypothetical protein [Halomonas sp.]
VNRLPGQARDLWQAGVPGLQRLWEAHHRDPRLWGVVVLAVLLWLVVSLIRRRRTRRPVRREEPYV